MRAHEVALGFAGILPKVGWGVSRRKRSDENAVPSPLPEPIFEGGARADVGPEKKKRVSARYATY